MKISKRIAEALGWAAISVLIGACLIKFLESIFGPGLTTGWDGKPSVGPHLFCIFCSLIAFLASLAISSEHD